jgi:serine O-acetyltransferase
LETKPARFSLFFLQNRVSEMFGVEIHPAAQIGKGILFDHGTGIVIGETAMIEDNVSMLHAVTLGGTGKQTGDRHPKIRQGVLIGAGAKILGNIEVGRNSKVAAGSVVLADVPPYCTVAGVPAKIVGHTTEPEPSLEMDHRLDYLAQN